MRTLLNILRWAVIVIGVIAGIIILGVFGLILYYLFTTP
jgi:hypothetical protein